jgi:hypothetical protein
MTDFSTVAINVISSPDNNRTSCHFDRCHQRAIIACLITEHTITINEVAIETGAGTPADDDRRTIFCGTVILRKRSTDDSYDQYFVTEDGDLGTRTPSTRAFLRDVG